MGKECLSSGVCQLEIPFKQGEPYINITEGPSDKSGARNHNGFLQPFWINSEIHPVTENGQPEACVSGIILKQTTFVVTPEIAIIPADNKGRQYPYVSRADVRDLVVNEPGDGSTDNSQVPDPITPRVAKSGLTK